MAEALTLAPGHLWSDHAWLRIAHTAGDNDAVVEVGDRMLAAGWDRIPEPIHHWRATYVEGLLAVGRLDDTAAVVAALEVEATRRADTPTTTEACRARGLLETARGNRAAAEAAFARGLALDATPARPLERAQLELAAGAARRRWGRRRAAADALEAAAERVAAAGAPTRLARVEQELAACGLRPTTRRAATRVDTLTPQEGFVARLVAAGRTNREVAAELVISAKTVEHHLTHIYAKLGVRSRTELAALLLGSGSGNEPASDRGRAPQGRGTVARSTGGGVAR
jgi:DNA-binding CsgD family transcriptional regulator